MIETHYKDIAFSMMRIWGPKAETVASDYFRRYKTEDALELASQWNAVCGEIVRYKDISARCIGSDRKYGSLA